MIYARVHYQTVAEDYFNAMQKVEQQLALPLDCPEQPPSASEMLVLINALYESNLTLEQTKVVSMLIYRTIALRAMVLVFITRGARPPIGI